MVSWIDKKAVVTHLSFRNVFLISLIPTIVFFVLRLYSCVPFLKLFFLLTTFACWAYYFARKTKISVLVSCLTVLLFIVIDIVVYKLFDHFLHQQNILLQTTIIYAVYSVLILLLAGYIKHHKRKELIIFPFSILISISLLGITTQIFSINLHDAKFFIIALFVFIILLCFSILNVFMYIEHEEKIELEEENQQKDIYISMLERVSQDISKLEHDLRNIIYASTSTNKKSEILQNLKEILDDLHQQKVIINNLAKISIPEIRSLLFSKIIEIIHANILLIIDIKNDINIGHIKTLDFCRVIGNLIDNAIENTLPAPEKQIVIVIDTNMFLIQNTFIPKENFNVYEIFKKGYTTKPHGKGLGLVIVREIIDKYKNMLLLNTIVQDNFFIQQLYINNKGTV